MYEYEILRIKRASQKKIREVTNKKGKIETQTYTEVETFEYFDVRVKKVLNDFASKGWQVVSINYSLPIEGFKEYMGTGAAGWSSTDFNSAEFVVVLQRNKDINNHK